MCERSFRHLDDHQHALGAVGAARRVHLPYARHDDIDRWRREHVTQHRTCQHADAHEARVSRFMSATTARDQHHSLLD